MKWLADKQHKDPFTTLWLLVDNDQAVARVQVFDNQTACYWLEHGSVAKEAANEDRAKQLALIEVEKIMAPVRAPFGINRFKFSRSWLPYFKLFRNPALFYVLFEMFKFQTEGFILLTLCLWYRAFQLQVPFPAKWIRADVAQRFPKHQLLSIREPSR
jgi:hypothetical protein